MYCKNTYIYFLKTDCRHAVRKCKNKNLLGITECTAKGKQEPKQESNSDEAKYKECKRRL